MKQQEVAMILTTSNTLTVAFLSEIKAPMQDSTLNIHIDGYTTYYALRESPTGGMCALVRENRQMSLWEGLCQEPNVTSERIWVMDHKNDMAFCGLYLRPDAPTSSYAYMNNDKILNALTEEIMNRKNEGYFCVVLGDLNAHVKVDDNFYFTSYPHAENNNGKLVGNFARMNNLYCLNGL